MADQGSPTPLFLDLTEARRAETIFFETGPPPYLRLWVTALSPSPAPLFLKVWMLRDVKMFKYNIGIREKHLVIAINVSNTGANYK